jgi:polysaccharide deacetylase family protein (PEP-CTERM system associated)
MRREINNAFTIDVEDYFHVSAYNAVVDRNDWDTLPSRVERNTDKIMAILDDAETNGTFFVLGWVAQRYPELIKRIADCGHEVACHGMSHKLVYLQGREKFKEEARDPKALLEDIIGNAVIGYRAASFSITKASLWALDDLAELGFTYDSSIFPIHHDVYGIPDAPTSPFNYVCSTGLNIAEFPMSTLNVFGWRIPVSGGGYFRIYPYALTKAALRSRENNKETSVFYAHPWEVDPDQPLFDGGFRSNFRHRTNLKHCETRLRHLLADFSFSPMNSVLESLELPQLSLSGGRLA